MIKFLSGMGVGAVAVVTIFFAFDWISATSGYNNKSSIDKSENEVTLDPLDEDDYRLRFEGPLYDGLVWPPESDPNDTFKLVQQKHLLNIVPEDLDQICFTKVLPDEDDYMDLKLHFFMNQKGRDRLFAAMEKGTNEAAIFYFYTSHVADLMPTQRSIGWAKQQLEEEADTTKFAIGRNPDLSFNGFGDSRRAMLFIASYFSPDKIPAGCNSSFDPANIEWWNIVTSQYWQLDTP